MKIQVQALGTIAAVAMMSCLAAPAQAPAPSAITTTDGRTYHQATVVRVEPDGLIVSYEPAPGGIGLAKLRFQNLPESLRNEYGYDPKRAAEFAQAQAQANAQWRAASAEDGVFQRYRDLAEQNRALGGDRYTTFSTTLESNGKVSAQGSTGNVLPYGAYLLNPLWLTPGTATTPEVRTANPGGNNP